MEFHEAFAGVHVLETCHDYVRADDPLNQAPETYQSEVRDTVLRTDEGLWLDIQRAPERHWGQKIHFTWAGLSEWVARVPGLYWAPGAAALAADTSRLVRTLPLHPQRPARLSGDQRSRSGAGA